MPITWYLGKGPPLSPSHVRLPTNCGVPLCLLVLKLIFWSVIFIELINICTQRIRQDEDNWQTNYEKKKRGLRSIHWIAVLMSKLWLIYHLHLTFYRVCIQYCPKEDATAPPPWISVVRLSIILIFLYSIILILFIYPGAPFRNLCQLQRYSFSSNKANSERAWCAWVQLPNIYNKRRKSPRDPH